MNWIERVLNKWETQLETDFVGARIVCAYSSPNILTQYPILKTDCNYDFTESNVQVVWGEVTLPRILVQNKRKITKICSAIISLFKSPNVKVLFRP